MNQHSETTKQAMRQAAMDTLVHLLDEYLALWEKKQADYGYENIGLFQEKGVVIRLCDKLMRLKSHYVDGRKMQNESIEDTWLDCIGYGLIGLVCARGLWPKFEMEDLIAENRGDETTEKILHERSSAWRRLAALDDNAILEYAKETAEGPVPFDKFVVKWTLAFIQARLEDRFPDFLQKCELGTTWEQLLDKYAEFYPEDCYTQMTWSEFERQLMEELREEAVFNEIDEVTLGYLVDVVASFVYTHFGLEPDKCPRNST